jgi:hypothetical protein
MTLAASTNAHTRAPDSMRKIALAGGLLYLLTFVSIPRLALFDPILNDPTYILGGGSETGILIGIVLEMIVGFAIVGTGVALFPALKRQNEGVALGFVTARVFETGVIAVGILSLLAVLSMRQNPAAGTDATSLVATGQALVEIQNWTFKIGQGLMPGINALLLGYLFFRSGLVPRIIPAVGLIGAPLIISSVLGQLFGINDQFSAWSLIATLPIFLWELALGVWLVVKGFRPAAVAALGASSPGAGDVASAPAAEVVVAKAGAA